MPDWDKAREWLYEVERMYKEIGGVGQLALVITIDPLIHRYESGERSEDLYDEIMSLK